ncbi:uncharacterized protein [Argopecten irradians]|uniref:uncharacterized protein n=1 Tax=Argopecten irradians TaxID=31199 RepID=UPI00371AA6EB
MTELNRHDLQIRLSNAERKTMGDEEQILMSRIEGSDTELPTMVSMNKEIFEEKGRQKEYVCRYCNKVFSKQKNLKVHMCIHTGEKKLQCNICGKCFIQSCHLKRHMRSHSGEKPYSCDICGNQFSQNGHLRVHLKSHFGNKNYKCEYCPMAFVQNSHLKRHMRSHLTIRPYKCDMCDKTYKFSDHLYIHLRRHTGETPYHCTFCDKSFHTSANLNAHIKIHNKYVDRKYKCQICVKKFHTNYALVKHMAVHTSDTPYTCHLCSKSFKYKGNLKHHFDVHSNDADVKMLKCVICIKQCTSFQNLKDHMLAHYEETYKVHKCEICDKTFKIKSSLKMHHSLHNGNKLAYRCLEIQCEFEAGTVEEMKNHSANWHNVQTESGTSEDALKDSQSSGFTSTHGKNSSCKVQNFKCPTECTHSFDNITDLVNHLKCHIKLEKNKKPMKRIPNYSNVSRLTASSVKKTVLGQSDSTAVDIQTRTFRIQPDAQVKPSTQLDPVSMLIKTAEQVLPSCHDQSGIGDNIREDQNATRDKILLIREHTEERNSILQSDCSNTRYSNHQSTGKETLSAMLPEQTASEALNIPSINSQNFTYSYQTIPSASTERIVTENPHHGTNAASFGSKVSTIDLHPSVSSSVQFSENNYQIQRGDYPLNTMGEEHNENSENGALGNPSFIIKGNANQSFVVGGHVIRMLENSDGSISTESLQVQSENIEEIIVDERTMHELVIGTSALPLTSGIHGHHSANFQQLGVGEMQEVTIPDRQKSDITDERSVNNSMHGTNSSNLDTNKETAASGLNSHAEPIAEELSAERTEGRSDSLSSALLHEADGSRFQYMPYTNEKNDLIASIGDHRYVLTHGEETEGDNLNKITTGHHHQDAEEIKRIPNHIEHSRVSTNSPQPQMHENRNNVLMQCPFCTEQFQDEISLKGHLSSHMSLSEKVVVNIVMYMCHLCETEFNSKDNLKNHLQTHN